VKSESEGKRALQEIVRRRLLDFGSQIGTENEPFVEDVGVALREFSTMPVQYARRKGRVPDEEPNERKNRSFRFARGDDNDDHNHSESSPRRTQDNVSASGESVQPNPNEAETDIANLTLRPNQQDSLVIYHLFRYCIHSSARLFRPVTALNPRLRYPPPAAFFSSSLRRTSSSNSSISS